MRAILLTLFLTTPALGVVNPRATPWLRLNLDAHYLKLNRQGDRLAFTGPDGVGLHYIDLKTRDIFAVSEAPVEAAVFWAPDGRRLFFRELGLTETKAVKSLVRVHDTKLHKTVDVRELGTASGFLSFDPHDLRMHLLHPGGVLSERLVFPDERLARWQISQRHDRGKWLATPKAIVWLSDNGLKMRTLKDDASGVESFDVSPDGRAVAWATRKGQVFVSRDGNEPERLAEGRDPSWHPKKPVLAFAAARTIGGKVLGYDLKIMDLKGTTRRLTRTDGLDERWPRWTPDGNKLIYTGARTTDLYHLDFTP